MYIFVVGLQWWIWKDRYLRLKRECAVQFLCMGSSYYWSHLIRIICATYESLKIDIENLQEDWVR